MPFILFNPCIMRDCNPKIDFKTLLKEAFLRPNPSQWVSAKTLRKQLQ